MPSTEIPPWTRRGMYDQGVWWKANVEGWVKIADMTRSHRLATARMLLRRAASLAHSLGFDELGLMHGAPDDVVDEWMRDDDRRMSNPQEWVRGLPLYRALTADLKVDARTDDEVIAQARDAAAQAAAREVAREALVEIAVDHGPSKRAQKLKRTIVVDVLTAVLEHRDSWVKTMTENEDARDPRDSFYPWFGPDDIKHMAMDVARQFDAHDFAQKIGDDQP